MDSKTVVGVGNIYANEARFSAGIHPKRLANRVSKKRYVTLTHSIKQILLRAVSMGGTTLRDFTNEDGKPGYFSQSLQVYGRARKPCIHCATTLKEIRINQRSTVYCSKCQN
jgi:formamidopyrimidine-DNA glycosylase